MLGRRLTAHSAAALRLLWASAAISTVSAVSVATGLKLRTGEASSDAAAAKAALHTLRDSQA